MIIGRWFKVLIAISLCVLAGSASAQTTPVYPDTPPGKMMDRLLTAFNSGEEEQWKTFINEQWKPSDKPDAFERRVGLFSMVYGDTRGLDFNRIEATAEYMISALFKARNAQSQFEWVTVEVRLDSLPPHQVSGVSVRPADSPEYDIPDKKLNHEELGVFLDKYLEDLVANDKFSGTVLIAKDGIPLYTRVYGEACKRYNVPNKLDTKFNLGSMNKMFTGVAIMQLVEQGKISVDDKVGKYLPDIPRQEIADKVTIHQLLTHTSGMQDYWDEIFAAPWWEIKAVAQMGELVFDDSLLFEPGTDYHYSNSGPIVLGMIIEKVAGQDYFDYIREHIYQPAGMINSDCYEMDREVPNLAIGYTRLDYDGNVRGDGEWYNNLFMHVIKGGPAGGGFSTVEDLLNFDIALRQNKLLSQESFDIMTTGKTERRPGTMYAYLFQDRTVNGHRIVGHSGGAPGINAVLHMFLDSGYTVAVMSNYDNGASTVGDKIEELLAN